MAYHIKMVEKLWIDFQHIADLDEDKMVEEVFKKGHALPMDEKILHEQRDKFADRMPV